MAAKSLLALAGLLLVVCSATAAFGCDTSQLIPCLPAAKSNPEPPTGLCCNMIHQLTSDCLCTALQSSLAKFGGVDFYMALQLPHKCGRYVPKGTKCGDATVPTGTEEVLDHHEATQDGMDHHENDGTMDPDQHTEERKHATENEMNNGKDEEDRMGH